MKTCLPGDELPWVEDPKSVLEYSWRYSLDLSKLKTHEDVLKVLNHLAKNVDLTIQETEGIEQYVKPSTLSLHH